MILNIILLHHIVFIICIRHLFNNKFELFITYLKLNIIIKNDNSSITIYLKSIAKYFETQTILSGEDADLHTRYDHVEL